MSLAFIAGVEGVSVSTPRGSHHSKHNVHIGLGALSVTFPGTRFLHCVGIVPNIVPDSRYRVRFFGGFLLLVWARVKWSRILSP